MHQTWGDESATLIEQLSLYCLKLSRPTTGCKNVPVFEPVQFLPVQIPAKHCKLIAFKDELTNTLITVICLFLHLSSLRKSQNLNTSKNNWRTHIESLSLHARSSTCSNIYLPKFTLANFKQWFLKRGLATIIAYPQKLWFSYLQGPGYVNRNNDPAS